MNEMIPLTPEQQHESAERTIAAAQLLVAGAAIDASGVLRPTNEQINALYTQGPDRPLRSQDDSAKAEKPQTKLEHGEQTEITPEKLKGILDNSFFFYHGRKARGGGHGQEIAAHSPEWPEISREFRNSIDRYLQNQTDYRAFAETGKPFVDAGVSEVMTVTDMKDTYEVFDNEPVTLLQYAVLSDVKGSSKYFYPEFPKTGAGRKSSLSLTVLLKQSDAACITAAVQQDPMFARQMVEAMITRDDLYDGYKTLGPATTWEDHKPPYEQWREQNGGWERLAIRPDNNQGIKESQIITF
jgi:hypothetical protein